MDLNLKAARLEVDLGRDTEPQHVLAALRNSLDVQQVLRGNIRAVMLSSDNFAHTKIDQAGDRKSVV